MIFITIKKTAFFFVYDVLVFSLNSVTKYGALFVLAGKGLASRVNLTR
jgi:hypothetical protein